MSNILRSEEGVLYTRQIKGALKSFESNAGSGDGMKVDLVNLISDFFHLCDLNAVDPQEVHEEAWAVYLKETGKCKRCGTQLIQGYCKDGTCPHNNHKQDEYFTEE